MTRDEMIEVLIEDKFSEWIYAGCTDSLEEMLLFGWKGLEDYTDQELKETIEEMFTQKQVKEYLESSNQRRERNAKIWEDNKKVLEKAYKKVA